MGSELYLDIAGDQIDGARDYQEDSYLITYVDDADGQHKATALLAMADGVGGAAAGNIASQLVVNMFNRQFTSRYTSEEVPDILSDALERANKSLRSTVKETPALEGMGCTLVTAAVVRGKMWWISVGDSHLYLLRRGKLIKKNADHSYGAYLDLMAARGTPVEPDPNLRRNMLMSALSGDEIAMIDNPRTAFLLLPGDRLIICSDGLDTLDHDKILEVSTNTSTPKECVDALLKAVTAAAKPRQDNTTVIVCDVIARMPDAPAIDKYAQTGTFERIRRNPWPARVGWIAGIAVVAAAAWLLVPWTTLTETVREFTKPAEVAVPPVVPDEPIDVVEPDVAPEPEVLALPTFRDGLSSGGDGPLMVSLPGGEFTMGVRGSSDPAETPFHDASAPPFAIGVYEVTFAEYDRFARATGRARPDSQGLARDNHPVFDVSWHDAAAYAEWLSRETGQRYSLPSEAQWEYAASAGRSSPYWWGFRMEPGRAHCFNCTPGLPARLPTAVGSFPPNPFGLHDTVGNVAEWVQDCFHPTYRGAPADGSVWEGGDCSVRVVRGGHFASPQPNAQRRDRFAPDRGYPDIGFRVVRTP